MHKKFLRKTALVLAGLLVITGLNPASVTTNAAESVASGSGYVTTYSLSELASAGGYGFTATENGSSTTIEFAGQYQEAKYAIPEEVLDATLTGYSANLSDSNGGYLSLKVYNASGSQAAVTYGNTSINVDASVAEVASTIGLMSLSSDPYTINVDSISFYTANAAGTVSEGPAEPAAQNKVTYAGELTFYNRWNGSDTKTNTLTYSSQYSEYCYDFDQTFDFSACKSVTVKVADQGNNVCFKFYDASKNQLKAYYSNYGQTEYVFTPDFDGEVCTIAVMSMPEAGDGVYPYSITIESIEVEMEAAIAPKNEERIEYTAENITLVNSWDDSDVLEDTTISFGTQWNEYGFALENGLDMEACKEIIVEVSGQGNTVAFKVYNDSTELQPFYGKNGQTKYSLTPSCDGICNRFAIMSSVDVADGVYPYGITIEKVTFVMDTTPAGEKVEKGVEYDIVNLRDAVGEVLGEDFIIGTAISYQEFADSMEMELVTKHFNGVTLGNELKPDSMIKSGANMITVEVDGEEIVVPELNFSTPDRYLNFFCDWNEAHPDQQIKIRGHVLVWHSQTPDFFFHEDYDTSKPYVSTDVMNKRLEYYIKTVAEHYTGADSKYKDMFYGWDVVNEAISDSTGTYRNNNENSKWWAVYHSNEFICNAFVYANKYMPASIKLFYNDYNEYVDSKVKGISALLTAVKNTEGARIDGMGMQGHYQTSNNPTMEQFSKAVRTYCAIVDEVQITELDFKGATSSTDEALAQRYKDVYDTIRRLREDGCNVTGMTIWGVVDKHSWLQTANTAGGGSTSNSKQYPLLFDNNYKAKNAFYAIANAGVLTPEIKSVVLVQSVIDDFKAGNTYTFKKGGDLVSFVPMWNEESIRVQITVPDATVDEADAVTLYVAQGDAITAVTADRAAATTTEAGYTVVLEVALSADSIANNDVKLDIVVTDNDKSYAFNDTTYNQSESAEYYAITTLKPSISVEKGTVIIDGDANDYAWAYAPEIPLTINIGSTVSAVAKLLWDNDNLYVLVDVKDAILNKDASNKHEQDSLEVFIDENNHKTSSYEEDDKQYRINYLNEHSFNGTKCVEANVNSAATITEDGYRIEAAFAWTDITPELGAAVGLELQINDADTTAKRLGTLSWADKSGTGWSSTAVFGTIVLVNNVKTLEISGLTDVTYNGKSCKPAVTVSYDGTVLKKNKDYTVSYANNKNAGVAIVTVTGINNYAGMEAVKTFKILPASLETDELEFTLNYSIVLDKNNTPAVYVKSPTLVCNGKRLAVKTDYTTVIKDATGARVLGSIKTPGTYYVEVTAVSGNFTGTYTRAIEITKDEYIVRGKVIGYNWVVE